MPRRTTLVEAFGRQATQGLRRWVGMVGSRWAGIDLVGAGEMDGVDKLFYGNGREVPEFDSGGARNWRFWSSDKGTPTGPPSLIPGLPNFKPDGQSWIEWLLPAELSQGVTDAPEPNFYLLRCLKVHDYTVDGSGNLVQGAKIFSANNALVALFIATQKIGRPLSGFHGQDWIDFKALSAATIPYDAGSGLKGEYFADETLATLKRTRNEAYIDFNWDYISPAADVPAEHWSARFMGKVKPKFTETYTFYVRGDDGFRLWVNNAQIVNDWSVGAEREASGTIALTAGTEYDIRLEYFQSTAQGSLRLSWSSASQAKEVIPQKDAAGVVRLIPPTVLVERYSAHLAFPQTTPAPTAFEAVMRRAPGCDWYKANGKIRLYLTPDRPTEHRFVNDPSQSILRPNIVGGTFLTAPRSPEDIPDYATFTFFDLDDPLYREREVVVDRRADPTKPPRNPLGPVPLGVCTYSLASRIAETEMNLLALSLYARLTGFCDSYKLTKGGVCTVSHPVAVWTEAAGNRFMAVEEKFLARKCADDRSFVLRLHDPGFYSDNSHKPQPVRVVQDIRSPYVPPPRVASVQLSRGDRWLPDETNVPLLQGVVTFSPFYAQRGRVYWKRPRKVFTADAATNTLAAQNHGYPNGAKIENFNTGGALPAPLAAATAYYVVNATQNTYQLALAPGGAAIDLTTAGTGTHEVREYDFTDTGVIVTPDPATLLGAFEIENAPLGFNDVKVVAESLKGISRGVADAAVVAFNVLPLANPPDAYSFLLNYGVDEITTRTFAPSQAVLDAPDFDGFIFYDAANVEKSRSRSGIFSEPYPTGTPAANYTFTRKAKIKYKGNRVSANYNVWNPTYTQFLQPFIISKHATPTNLAFYVGLNGSEPQPHTLIRAVVIEVYQSGDLTNPLYTDTVPGSPNLKVFTVRSQYAQYTQLKIRAKIVHLFNGVILDSPWSNYYNFNLARMAAADVVAGTPANGDLAKYNSSTQQLEYVAPSAITVTSAAGTANQVLVNGGTGAQSGAIVLSLPPAIVQPSSGGFAAGGALPSGYQFYAFTNSANVSAGFDIRSNYYGVSETFFANFGDWGSILSHNREPQVGTFLNSAVSPNQFRAVGLTLGRIASGGAVNARLFSLDHYPGGNLAELLGVDLDGKFLVQKGVGQGGGVKHQRFATGMIAAGAIAAVTCNWSTAFADANYSVVPTVATGAGKVKKLQIVGIQDPPAAGSVVVYVENPNTMSEDGVIHLVAFHD